MSKTHAEMPHAPHSMPSLGQFGTSALLDELERRALGILCVAVRVEEAGGTALNRTGSQRQGLPVAPDDGGRGGDTWYYRVKGSNIMLGALSAAITIKLQKVLEGRGRRREGDLESSEK